MAEIARHEADLDGELVVWREAAVADGGDPIVYLHGNPTSGAMWAPFLQRTGGLAPDMLGFGQSSKRGDHPYDPDFCADVLERFLRDRGIDRVRLVLHDWGAGWGLTWAQQHPERVSRLVIIDGVPLLPGYRWHWIGRLWRLPGVGEIAVGGLFPPVLKLVTRQANVTKGPMPADWLEHVNRDWDQGTQRAVLRLYRWSDPDKLAAQGARLGAIAAPALVLWGAQDPYVPARFAQAYADALGGPAEVDVLEGAGHWSWLDRPDMVDRVATFLASG